MSARQGGFTLLEVVVALAILSLSLGVLMRIFGGAARNAAAIEQHSHALLLAESQLALVGEDEALGVGTHQGEAMAMYWWRVTVEPYGEARAGAIASSLSPYRVSVEVRWGADSAGHVELRTVRLLRAR